MLKRIGFQKRILKRKRFTWSPGKDPARRAAGEFLQVFHGDIVVMAVRVYNERGRHDS